MPRSWRCLFLAGLLFGTLALMGCDSGSNTDSSTPKALEHTDSKPPPWIIEQQKQQAQRMEEAAKHPLPKKN